MAKKFREVVIPKEQARFWLDRDGFWHNEDEKFQHRKIIDYFHSSIRRDKGGYHLLQTHSDHREKVYFPYEDTPLFVFEVIKDNDVILVLNNKKRIKLKPKSLFIRDDSLYMQVGEERIKFAEHALIRIADLLEYENDQCFIRAGVRRYKIQELLTPMEGGHGRDRRRGKGKRPIRQKTETGA